MASTPANNDVVTEILLHLPVQSLLRFRTVCKFWCDVIDSPSFRKLHTHNNNDDNNNDTVHLEFTFIFYRGRKLAIKLLHNGKSLTSYNNDHFNDFPPFLKLLNINYNFLKLPNINYNRLVNLAGPVKGLICINCKQLELPVAICNPFLGQLKILPIMSSSCRIDGREVAIGFDQDYKVVQLLSCGRHRRLHAQLYSRRTSSWRDLAGDDGVLDHQYLGIVKPIKSTCKNGSFAHWRVMGPKREDIILSLDMKNEVFRTITMPDFPSVMVEGSAIEIFAEDRDRQHSFLLFVLPCVYSVWGSKSVKIYESRCEESKLSWKHLMNVEQPFCGIPLWRSDCVVLKNYSNEKEVIVYDHRARKFVGRFELRMRSEIVEYKGSFVSL